MPPLIIVGKCGTKRRLTKQRMGYAGYSGYTRKDGVRQKGSALSIYEGMLIPFLYIPCLILFCRFQIDHSGFQHPLFTPSPHLSPKCDLNLHKFYIGTVFRPITVHRQTPEYSYWIFSPDSRRFPSLIVSRVSETALIRSYIIGSLARSSMVPVSSLFRVQSNH